MMRISRWLIPFFVFGRLSAALAGEDREVRFSIDETLKNAAFNTHHMPTEKALSETYGEGRIYRRPGRVYHVYFLRDLNLWLRCRGDSEDRQYAPISEITISKIDLGAKSTPRIPVLDPNLKGVHVGDNIRTALAQWG